MNYKISTYVLLVVLAGFIVYSCQSKQEAGSTTTDDSTASRIASAEDCPCRTVLTDSLAENLKSLNLNITRGSGDLIPSADARAALAQFKTDFNIQCNDPDPKYIHGFSFGIEKFLKFADEVKRLDGNNQQILGVRVYYARKKRPTGPNLPDVFLIPIGNDGRSIYDIDECDIKNKAASAIRNGDVVLNTSIPCPNQCQ